LLLAVRVHSAAIQDRDGADDVLERAKKKYSTLVKLFADAGYAGQCVRRIREKIGLDVEIVRRSDDRLHGPWQGAQLPLFVAVSGFQVLPKRWVVERTHAWTGRPRRMAKDHDQRTDVSEAWIWFTQARLLLGRLAEPAVSPDM
jgi:putative transposase